MSIISSILSDDFDNFKKSILKNKKNLKLISQRFNMVPFELAVVNDRYDMVEYLLDNQESFKTSFNYNRQGGKLMMSAVVNIKMAELLKKYNFSVAEPYTSNIIDQFISMNSTIGTEKLPELVEWALINGAEVNGDGNYWSPLMNATAGNHTEVMKILVKYGADINASDWNNRRMVDIVPNNEKTAATAMSFGPKLTTMQLKRFANDFPNELSLHPELNEYIVELIELGFEHILPKELIEIFLF